MARVSSKQSIFFFGSNQNKLKLNLFRLFSGLFCETQKLFFGLFWCFGPVSNNGNKHNFVETNQKNLQKSSLLEGLQNSYFFFLVRTETHSVLVVFRFFFLTKPTNFLCFVSVFRTGIETTKTNRTCGMGNEKGLYLNKFAAVSVSLLFVSVVSKHRNSLF